MKIIHFTLLFFVFSLFITCGLQAEVTTQQKQQLQRVQNKIEAIKSKKPKDTEFRFTTGVNIPMEVIKKTAGTFAPESKILKADVDGYYDLKIEDIEKRQNKFFEKKKSVRQEKIQKIDQKHKRYEKLESEIASNGKRAEQELKELGTKSKLKGKKSVKLKAKINKQTRLVTRAKVKKQYIRTKKVNLGKSRNMSKYMKLRREIAATKREISKIKLAKKRGAKFSKGNLIFGTVLTAISSELQENAQAEQEGRKPLAINKLKNFVSDITGYSAIQGVSNSVDLARMEAMVETRERYEANGFDLNDPKVYEMVMKRMEGAARRAAVDTAVYEGSKLAPVIGDMITVKEGFDAAGEAYVALEETGFTVANNEEVQFQTSLRAVVKANKAASELESIVNQINVLNSSLGKMGDKLKQFNKQTEANRKKVSNAIEVLDAYNMQAEALKNSNVLAILESDSVSGLKKQLAMIKSSADEQAANVERVKAEHESGELTIQAVATQAGFIGNLLQPVTTDYQGLSQTIAGIEALTKGAALTDKVPQAQAVIEQTRDMMGKDAKMSAELYETYSNQADNLEFLFKKYQAAKAKLPKLRNHALASNNLQEGHMERILSAIDRAENINFDQNALKRTIAAVRRLRNTSEKAGAISDLYEAPQTVDTAQIKDLVHKAQQAWEELSGPNQAASDCLQNAQNLLQELIALAGSAEPMDGIAESPSETESDVKLQGKLFAGKNLLQLTPYEICMALTNKTTDGAYIHNEFFGFKIPEACNQTKEWYCPELRKLYKVLGKGTTTRQWGNKHYKVPYFITLQLHDFRAEINFSPNWTRELAEYHRVKFETKPNKARQEKIEIIPYHIPNADESLIIKKTRNNWSEIKFYARKDQLIMEANAKLEAWLEPIEGISEGVRFSGNILVNPGPNIIKSFGKEVFAHGSNFAENQDKILGDLINPLLAEAAPVIKKMVNHFYLQPITFDLHFGGLIPAKNNSKYAKLRRNAGVMQNFSRKEIRVINGEEHDFWEHYRTTIWWRGELGFRRSIQDRIDELNKEVDKKVGNYLSHSSFKRNKIQVNIAGADYVKMGHRNVMAKSITAKFPRYQWDDYLAIRVANIVIIIDSYGTSPEKDKQTRTREIAEKIVSIVRNSPKGW